MPILVPTSGCYSKDIDQGKLGWNCVGYLRSFSNLGISALPPRPRNKAPKIDRLKWGKTLTKSKTVKTAHAFPGIPFCTIDAFRCSRSLKVATVGDKNQHYETILQGSGATPRKHLSSIRSTNSTYSPIDEITASRLDDTFLKLVPERSDQK